MKIEETTVELINTNSKVALQKTELVERSKDIEILLNKINKGLLRLLISVLNVQLNL